MNIDIDPEDLITRTTDERGRLTLGSKHAGKKVTVAIVHRHNKEGDDQ